MIQHVGDSSFQFLGMHIHVPPNPAAARDALKQSVVSMLKAIYRWSASDSPPEATTVQTGHVPSSHVDLSD